LKAAIIVNPFSGGGKNARVWGEIRDEVRSRIGGLVEFTTGAPNDATRFAKEIATNGNYDLLIAAGGDGTVNEVINGLFTEKGEAINKKLGLGILSAGRGCDFIRSVDIPSDTRKAVNILVNPKFQKVDLGCLFFRDEFGRDKNRFFINIASAGIAGIVAKKVQNAPRYLPPEMIYFGSAASTFFTSKGQKMKVTVDEREVFDGACINVFVANGKYSGAGMCWAPMAKVDDGKFEVIIIEPISKYKLFFLTPKIYDGSYISTPGVLHFTGSNVLIESVDDVYLEVDGEQPGVAPMAVKVLPLALNLAVGGD
jgi:diacylglycerol kinase (ATP)